MTQQIFEDLPSYFLVHVDGEFTTVTSSLTQAVDICEDYPEAVIRPLYQHLEGAICKPLLGDLS